MTTIQTEKKIIQKNCGGGIFKPAILFILKANKSKCTYLNNQCLVMNNS